MVNTRSRNFIFEILQKILNVKIQHMNIFFFGTTDENVKWEGMDALLLNKSIIFGETVFARSLLPCLGVYWILSTLPGVMLTIELCKTTLRIRIYLPYHLSLKIWYLILCSLLLEDSSILRWYYFGISTIKFKVIASRNFVWNWV